VDVERAVEAFVRDLNVLFGPVSFATEQIARYAFAEGMRVGFRNGWADNHERRTDAGQPARIAQ
jgi:hypothetical protein